MLQHRIVCHIQGPQRIGIALKISKLRIVGHVQVCEIAVIAVYPLKLRIGRKIKRRESVA